MPRSPTQRHIRERTLSRLRIMLAFAMICHASNAMASDQKALQAADFQRIESAAEALDRLHALVVAENGEIVYERAFDGPGVDQPANIKSLSKTVLAALVGAAIEKDILQGPDQPVAELLGPLMPDAAESQVNEITVGHLLSLQAGLERTSGDNYGAWVMSPDWVEYALTRPFVDEPGGRMLYSTGSSHLLSAALTQSTGESTLVLARRLLGEPLDIAIPHRPRDPQGIYFGGNDMQLSPRALVQLGELYRQDGVVNGTRVLPEGWTEASWTARGRSPWTGDGYGYGWFITTLAGERVYYGRGYGGQALFVVPERELTVAITSDPLPPSPGGQFQGRLNRLIEILLGNGEAE
ncbi:serine hydrolase domain-containing protein [Halomonas korlensis]|uniref:CubicO group peptidase, beta-lactamase class C family n=1 Tax=Halomonas korlensis TaxID=463301 RepID=A0A1I7F6Q4_9GAMM|nr:serine hydrolase [Halomonas korlensis]SFU31809.1 CubicO group peptidase, beta-lactamase class C family [Halomonas korlensis]